MSISIKVLHISPRLFFNSAEEDFNNLSDCRAKPTPNKTNNQQVITTMLQSKLLNQLSHVNFVLSKNEKTRSEVSRAGLENCLS